MTSAVPRVAVVNYSTTLKDAAVAAFVPAIQRQVSRDFAPIWGIDAIVAFTAKASVQPFHWVLGIYDNADQANALGDHSVTAAGKPVMKVFVVDSQSANVPLSSVASHEMLETLANAFIQSVCLQDNGDGTGTIFAQEVCDPVENDLYRIFSAPVSDFITPWWFGEPLPPGAKYDFLGKLSAPFTLSAGGYLSSLAITKTGLGTWQQSFADTRARQLHKLFS